MEPMLHDGFNFAETFLLFFKVQFPIRAAQTSQSVAISTQLT